MRKRKLKKVPYRLIARQTELGRPLYALLDDLVDAHHEDLRDARIALAWSTGWKPDVDGRLTLGKCKRASDLDRELSAFDFVILLNEHFWHDLQVTDLQRRALLDHELCHACLKFDTDGEPAEDERGRAVFRVRRHDLEEFACIADRYGCWKKDIEAFAQALDRARREGERWTGYADLQKELRAVGCSVPLTAIIEWTNDERREARTWAALRQDATVLQVITPPAFLAAITTT